MPDAVPPLNLASLAAGGSHPGALWRLDGEDLQANLVRLGPGDRIQPHRNDEVEVLMVVVSGRGELTVDGQSTSSPRWSWSTYLRGRSGRWRRSTGRWRTCRSTAAGWRDCRWVGLPSDAELPRGQAAGEVSQRACRSARCTVGHDAR
jgi:hypothetical protein